MARARANFGGGGGEEITCANLGTDLELALAQAWWKRANSRLEQAEMVAYVAAMLAVTIFPAKAMHVHTIL